MLVLFISAFFIYSFNKKVKPLLLSYAEQQIKNEMIKLANEIIKENYINKNYDYKSFLLTSTNQKNEIISIDFNSPEITNILNDITSSLILNLNEIENKSFLNNDTVYYIPFGIVSGLSSSNWIGPQIPIKVMNSGSIESKILTKLKPYGINNSLIEISIEINISNRILLPYTNQLVNITLELPLVKKVIQGNIPQVYGGMYSTSSQILRENIE